MLNSFIKNLSILKKFLFINLLVFIIFLSFTIVYLSGVQPNLINKKTSNHIQIIDNTIDHIRRLKIKFNENDIRKFLNKKKFLFHKLDIVIIFDENFNLIVDSDTLNLDPRSFSQKTIEVEMNILNIDEESIKKKAIKS